MSYKEFSFVSRQGNSSLRTRLGELRERHHPYSEHTRLFSFQETRGAEFGVHNGHQITVYSHPNDEGLVSLKYFLDKREVKDPPTEDSEDSVLSAPDLIDNRRLLQGVQKVMVHDF